MIEYFTVRKVGVAVCHFYAAQRFIIHLIVSFLQGLGNPCFSGAAFWIQACQAAAFGPGLLIDDNADLRGVFRAEHQDAGRDIRNPEHCAGMNNTNMRKKARAQLALQHCSHQSATP